MRICHVARREAMTAAAVRVLAFAQSNGIISASTSASNVIMDIGQKRGSTFWGPSVHWNTHLRRYAMLLNHAKDAQWRQEGVYVAFAARLDDPRAWSTPRRITSGGSWYPQVIGQEIGSGTDKVAGEFARFFMAGRSNQVIQFSP